MNFDGELFVPLSIVSAACLLAWRLGRIETKLQAIDKHLDRGARRMNQLDSVIDSHGERITRIESRLESAH